jgi:hypothetical protein
VLQGSFNKEKDMSTHEKMKTNYQSRIEWVRLSDLSVLTSAQRKFKTEWAKWLADNFNPDDFGVPLVVELPAQGKQPARKVIADGQHRCQAARLALGPNQMVQCEVIRGANITAATVAQLYLGRNRIRLKRAMDEFLAGVTAKEPECLAIKEIASDAGYGIGHGDSISQISAVISLRYIYRMGVLPETLDVIISSWGHTMVNGDILRGLGSVLKRYGQQLETRVLQRKLSQLAGHADGLLGRGRAMKTAHGYSTSQGVAAAIVSIYNSGRKEGYKLADWGRTDPKQQSKPAA